MKPDALIESYVLDVVRRLPRRQRNDVAYELRSLLTEELAGRAADAGREPDSATALELLRSFGRPEEVAERYRGAGFSIIRPADAPRFAIVALTGVAVQWIVTLVATFAAPSDIEPLSRLGAWWLSWGLGSFWWPGLLVSLSIVAGLVTHGRDRGREREWTPPRVYDRDLASRPAMALYIALGTLGAAVLIALPSLASIAPGLPQPVIDAFRFDDYFLAMKAPWVLLLWAATLATGIAVLVAGRWTRATRWLSIASGVAWIALVAWWISGPIFVSPAADGVTKLCLIPLGVLSVVMTVLEVRRVVPIREPAVS